MSGWWRLAALAGALLMPLPGSAQDRSTWTAPVRQVIDQALAAREANDPAGELAILERGLQEIGPEQAAAFPLYQQLGQYHADRGNVAQALRVAEAQGRVASQPVQDYLVLVKKVSLHAALFQLEKAEAAMQQLQVVMGRLRAGRGWQAQQGAWQAGAAWAGAHFQTRAGHLEAAEAGWRACLSFAEGHLAHAPEHAGAQFYQADCTAGLLSVLVMNGKLAEAGAVVAQQRQEIERLARESRRPALLSRLAAPFGRVALEQGRLDEARAIFRKALDELAALGSAEASARVAALRMNMALVDMLEGRWEDALRWHQARAEALERGKAERGGLGAQSPEYAYTLVRLGRPGEALEQMRRIVQARQRLFDDNSLLTWEGRAFLGLALAADGQRPEALRELRVAVPKVLALASGERSSPDSGALRTARLGWLLDGYLMLLGDIGQDEHSPERPFAIEEAFRIADVARGSVVQQALAVAASRARIDDPELAELARREQDLQREVSQLAEAIGNLLARGRVSENDSALAAMRANLAQLRQQQTAAGQVLARKFPDYANLITPRPVDLKAAQQALHPGEALLSIFPGSRQTLVWAVPHTGAPAFAVAPVTAAALGNDVLTLRRALDPNASNGNALPDFDPRVAHRLHAQLLQPVAAGWRGAREMIVVSHGRLAQLPLAVLMTAPWQAPPRKLPYAELAQAPWLLREVAISQLPSVVALTALRASRPASTARQPFIGIGDPLFDVAQAATPPAAPASATRGIVRRNLSLKPASGDLAAQIDFRLLPPLPDTAIELREIARVFAVDPEQAVFLRERASESRVRGADLADYRVVMFATHGLMSGEMPGLYQPALALSNPQLTGEGEDGMLTMEEILGMKLKADWVVLSACNTAAADGHGVTESFSGLGRAFFFAGARALLATGWAVETESARLLTTGIFQRLLTTPTLSRAAALQQSALALMQQSAGNDYSYAHPMFWAPYVLVGDGGR